MLAEAKRQEYVTTALGALTRGADWRFVLDGLPVPVYTTDSQGAVTYWNKACIDFAGREPQLGSDRWCVTWQLFTMAGDPMPHEDCPMAETVKSRSEVRGKVAIALRPDGTRRAFVPYPTPLFDEAGEFRGAVNLLIDVSEEQASELSDQAARCRRLARSTLDSNASGILTKMAEDYSASAETLRGTGQPRESSPDLTTRGGTPTIS
jgi:PAS domain-containing protein